MNGEQGDTATTIVIPVAMVLAGLAAYSAMDAVMKGLSIALGAYNALFWRYAGGVIIATGAALSIWAGAGWNPSGSRIRRTSPSLFSSVG